MKATPDGKFEVGQGVKTLVPCSGDDHRGVYRTVEPGATGTVDMIRDYGGSQGLAVTVVVGTGIKGDYDEEITIVNVFDASDGDLGKFIE